MPTLLILTGPRKGTHLPILGERFALGRDAECDATVRDVLPTATQKELNRYSRRHAVLTLAGGLWYLEDGDGRGRPSRYGTTLNGQPVQAAQRHLLRDRDRIGIFDIKMAFHADPESTFAAEASISHADTHPYLDTQTADRLRVLLDISAALRGTLDPDAVLDRTLEHLFRLFPRAERGLVVFRDSPTGTPVVRALRSARSAPADPRFSTTVIRRCLEGLVAVLGNDDLTAQFPDSQSLDGLSVRSLMCVPLWTPDGQALGAIQLDTTADGRKFVTDDLHLLLGVASQASIALSNARLHLESVAVQRRAADLELAEQVQQALLPRSLPDVPGYAFQPYYAAADKVGGDYYDFIPLAGGRLAVLLGDVSGHGVAAALVMARFGAQARACLEAEADLPTAVARLNALVLRAAVPDSFVTLAVVVLDPAAHTAAVVSAGHPSPLLRRADGAVEDVVPVGSSGMMLGIADGQSYECGGFSLGPGEAVVLYSDGVPEALDAADRSFGTDRVREVLAAAGPVPGATVAALVAAVRRHAAGCAQQDDITIVCLARAAG
jgi:serine phosphatase RsbU (regulator of sigma subunit)